MQRDVRHILRAGNCSLVVALPPGWLRYHKLKRGDAVEVLTNGEVRIKPLKGDCK
jgi:antitoxin component of MazEF toxin-antitoxin module